jgi:CRP/FNR family cyclic AMP-dependent transcriptional regulator
VGAQGDGEHIQVLAVDVELAGGLASARLEPARRACTAAVLTRSSRRWNASADAALARDGFGLLLIDGLLIRRVGREHRWGVELLGPGDLLRPWQHDGEESTMPFETSWWTLEQLRLAVLDAGFAERAAPYPEVAAALVGRAMARSRALATSMAVIQNRRAEDRLWMMLWHLAERFGRVRPDGVLIDLPLSHSHLAGMVALHRQAVTSALAKLAERGSVVNVDEGWLLCGEGPTESDAQAAASAG